LKRGHDQDERDARPVMEEMKQLDAGDREHPADMHRWLMKMPCDCHHGYAEK
jgi:hypothetical protein